MLTRDELHLAVLEDYWPDQALPKFKRPKDDVRDAYSFNSSDFPVTMSDSIVARRGSVIRSGITGVFPTTVQLSSDDSTIGEKPAPAVVSKRPWWKFWAKDPPALPPAPPPEPEPTMTIEQFFGLVKNTAKELEIVKERAAGYERAMMNAQAAGQMALYERLADGINAYKMETLLVSMGLTKYVEEQSIIDFYKKCKKGLRLDWVRHFTRTIPEDVVAKKRRADELGIFDNYVVLHYDPKAKAYAETKAEVAARKDPILFGLMTGRRQLYFVGDWIDEHCDLTLDQLAETIGRDAVKEIGSVDDGAKS